MSFENKKIKNISYIKKENVMLNNFSSLNINYEQYFSENMLVQLKRDKNSKTLKGSLHLFMSVL